jgi:acyl dehydratase
MSTSTEMQWNLGRVGEWGEPKSFEVTRERIVAYAEATNDEHPAHRSGDLAPPVFPVVSTLIEILGPAIMSVVPGELAMRVLHGEQDFRYHQPIVPGMKLQARAACVGVQGTASGAVVLGKAITETESAEPVVEQYMAAFFRGGEFDGSVGEALPPHKFPAELRDAEPTATVTQAFDADQTFRYSEASGDPMPIHLDENFAKSVGLPGIIIHGMCTMAFCGRAVISEFCSDDPTALKRLAVRLSKIVLPSEKITQSLWDAGDGRIVFETTSESGNTVIKDGLAEIAGG